MIGASDTELLNPLEFPILSDGSVFCSNEATLVGSWTGAGPQKDQTVIKVYLASSKQVKVNEVSPNDHSDFLGQ